MSAADIKMEIPVLVRSLKSSILSSTSLQMDKTFWGVVRAAVEQSRLMEMGNDSLEADPKSLQIKKNMRTQMKNGLDKYPARTGSCLIS